MDSSDEKQETLEAEIQQLVEALEGGFVGAYASGGASALEAAIAKVNRLAGNWDKEAFKPLLKALESQDDLVRSCVIEALGNLRDPRAVEPLCAALTEAVEASAPNDRLIQALVKIGDQRAVEPLIHSYKLTSYPNIATALGNLGDARAVEPLIDFLSRPPTQDSSATWHHIGRFYAARALGKLGDARALPILEQLRAHDTAPAVKTKSVSDAAAKAIENIRAKQSQEYADK